MKRNREVRRPTSTEASRAVEAGDLHLLAQMAGDREALDSQDSQGRTALHGAVRLKASALISVLLEGGANPSVADDVGLTPLHLAAAEGAGEAIALLLRAGVDVDAQDQHGRTALHLATFESRGRGDIIEMLLRAGADIHRKNRHGVSPLSLAESIANFSVRRWFPS